MSEPKHAKQMTTALDDGRHGPQARLQLRQNGHDVRGQLAQNAQFKAQMIAQMKGRGGAVQRRDYNHHGRPREWDPSGVDRRYLRMGSISDPAFAQKILKMVWPDKDFPLKLCSRPEMQSFTGEVLTQLLYAGAFLDVIPRPGIPSPAYVLDQIKEIAARAINDRGVYIVAIAGVQAGMSSSLNEAMGIIEGGVYTTERGLGF